jgi:hypothetical protein
MKLKNTPKIKEQRGSIIVSILIITLFLTTFIFSLIVLANANLVRARGRVLLLQAQYAAESGADMAIATLNSGNEAYTGTGSDITLLTASSYRSTFTVSVAPGADAKEKIVTATGKVFTPVTATTPSFTRKIEVIVQRSSLASSTSILSRNIIDIHSGVKSVKARDVYINGYLNMNKDTTEFIAENITVGDRNTGPGNCSIGGAGGELTKPATFNNAGQTKTNIVMAYNNCISPPGNTSNADFNVTSNEPNIPKVQSTYVPWTEFMDSSYQNSPGGCSDWTSGTSPRDIPSTGNTKKTHYPDTGPNISTTCGTSGNINLGSATYNIRDHVHIRANLCATSACTPIFNNPDTGPAGIKFVFIEGTINFNSFQTAPGSGSIVFVTYGGDPAGKDGVCPLGASVYLGNSGTTVGPAVYFLANNGICLDKTRFGATPSLGGISGKNVYISTNSGSPFDLGLDPLFPVDQIPVDLSWKAVRYRRL